MPFLLPPCLFDSIICFGPFGGCLTLVAGRTYGLLGSCPLPFHSFPGWALLGWRPSPSYLAHVLFFPVSVGLLAGDPTRPLCCFCYIITSLSFIFYYPCAYGLILLPCQSTFHIFTSFGFCWPTFNCASTIHSSGFLVPFTSFFTSFTLMSYLLNCWGFLGPITTSLPLITFRAYWPLSQPNEFTNSFPGLSRPIYFLFTSYCSYELTTSFLRLPRPICFLGPFTSSLPLITLMGLLANIFAISACWAYFTIFSSHFIP